MCHLKKKKSLCFHFAVQVFTTSTTAKAADIIAFFFSQTSDAFFQASATVVFEKGKGPSTSDFLYALYYSILKVGLRTTVSTQFV